MMRGLLVIVALLVALPLSSVSAAEPDNGLVDNPKYNFWANFKPGAVAVHSEKTALTGEEKSDLPDGIDEKVVTYTLLSVSNDKVVVRAVVVEKEFLGSVESAPTKITYPAKIKKAHLDAIFQEFGAKVGDKEHTLEVAGKEIKCKLLAGTHKKGNTVVDFQLYFSDSVPGGVVKRTRKTTQDDKVVAETTITLTSHKDSSKKK